MSINEINEKDINDLRMMIRAAYEVPCDKVIVIDAISLQPKEGYSGEVYKIEHRIIDKTD